MTKFFKIHTYVKVKIHYIWSNPGVNLHVCKLSPVCICIRMRKNTLYIPGVYTHVNLAHANWTFDRMFLFQWLNVYIYSLEEMAVSRAIAPVTNS